MADAATLELFDAIEDYVARAIEPLERELGELRARHAELLARQSTQPAADDAAIESVVARAIARLSERHDEATRDISQLKLDNVELRAAVAALREKALAISEIPQPRDGRDGAPGPSGAAGTDGRDGRDGWSPDDLEVELRDARTLVVRLRKGARVVERSVALPIPTYRGLFKPGEKGHKAGDVRTYGGSAFIALRDTDDQIGGDPPSPDWQLMVKRGRDAS